jgi:hypothetical protein
MAKLVQVSPTGPRNFTSVDEDGVVWRGEIKTYKSGPVLGDRTSCGVCAQHADPTDKDDTSTPSQEQSLCIGMSPRIHVYFPGERENFS